VIDELHRQRAEAALKKCVKQTETARITAKSTEITKTSVSSELRRRFEAELGGLNLTHLTVSVEPQEGTKGVMYHQVKLKNAQENGWTVDEVVSEGEHRCIALAAFLAELSLQDAQSAAVLDDPVSSLDHTRRDAVARRLVREATTRQLVVFTHDIVFLLHLEEEAERRGVTFTGRFLSREGRELGVPIDGLPWAGMGLQRRIGWLRNQAVRLAKVRETRPDEEYQKEAAFLWGRLREAWECGVEEILLNGAVKRFSRKVSTQPLKQIADITEQDIGDVDAGMTLSSTWMAGHDLSGAINTPMPEPNEFTAAVESLEQWRTRIRTRRK
jgi:hypothetical protein